MEPSGDTPEENPAEIVVAASPPRRRPSWRAGVASPIDSARDRAIEKTMNDFHKHAVTLENDKKLLEQRLQKSTEDLTRYQKEVQDLRQELTSKDSEMAGAKRDAQSKADHARMIEEQVKSEKERIYRMTAEADSLREEISRLTKSNVSLQEKLVEIETQSTLDDSEVVPLRFQVQRLTTELDSTTAHSNWLDAELRARNDQLKSLRAAQAAEMAQIRSEADQSVSEKESYASDLDMFRQQNEQLQTKLDQVSRELMHVKQEAADSKLINEKELLSERQLVNLQKDQLERLQQRYETISKQFEAQQVLAIEAEDDSRKESDDRVEGLESKMKKILEDQAAQYEERIKNLEGQLVESNRRREEIEDNLLSASPAKSTRPLLTLGGGGERVVESNEDEPINLTDLYTRLSETEDQLLEERNKRKRAEIHFSRLEADIRAKTPIMVRQRKEYETAMQRLEESESRMRSALSDARASRAEAAETQVELSRFQTRNKDLEEENLVLAKQVQVLLASSSGQEVADASQVPTNIREVQSQNQRLLGEHRQMTATINELKSKLKSDTLQRKLMRAEDELKLLREDREQQESIVEKIVQQRDLYRTLLSQHDKSIVQNEPESALQVVQQQSERSKQLEKQNEQLNNDVIALRSELSAAVQDRELTAGQLARYEVHTKELSDSVNRLQRELSSAKADAARSEASSAYSGEKAVRLEEKLQTLRQEIASLNRLTNELRQVVSKHESTVATARAESDRYANELRQVEQKLKMAEARVEVAKQAERRHLDEAARLRAEQAKQGSLLESLQRVEASLSVKSSEERESLKEQVAKLSRHLSSVESKHSLEVRRLEGRLEDKDVQMAELVQKEKIAKRDTDAAKASLEATKAELDSTSKKCSELESKLRSAKKRLGENEGDRDIEAELQEKVDNLTVALEGAKNEASALKERVLTYQKLAKDGEAALSELNDAMKQLKESHAKEIGELKAQIESIRTESTSRQDIIKELTADLSSHRGDRDKAIAELNGEIEALKAECDSCRKDAELAASRSASLESEMATLRIELSTSQNNYERELSLHANARTLLRTIRNEADAAIQAKNAAEQQNAHLKSELSEQKSLWDQDKSSLEESLEGMKKSLGDSQAQNAILHSQIDSLSHQAELNASLAESGDSAVNADAGALQKSVSELREVVKFLRSEKEILQGNLDLSQRAAEREKAASNVLKQSLDETRAEIKMLQGSALLKRPQDESDMTKLQEKITNAEENARLLSDSNNLLREQVAKLQKTTESLQAELDSARKAIEPLEASRQSLEIEKSSWQIEKESLNREVSDWKGRVQSLVSKFNQIDPEEHAQALKKVKDLGDEVASLKASMEDSSKENMRIRSLAQRVKSELTQNKNLVEAQKKAITRLTAEKDSLSTKKDDVTKKELEQVKEQLAKTIAEKTSDKLQLDGANERNQNLLNMLRQLKGQNAELKKKENNLFNQLKEAKSTIAKQATAAQKSVVTDFPSKPAVESGSLPVASNESVGKDVQPTQSAAPASAQEAVDLSAPKPKTIPKVPSGGFKFGPSDGPAANSDSAAPSAPSAAPSHKKRPSSELTSAGAAPSPAPAAARAPTPPKTNVTATPNAEMSMKEKLLEKKRKALMDLKKAKEMKVSKVDSTDAEPAAKRSKIDSTNEASDTDKASTVPSTEVTPTPGGATKGPSPAPTNASPALNEAEETRVKDETEAPPMPVAQEAAKPTPIVFGMGSAPMFGAGAKSSFGSIVSSAATSMAKVASPPSALVPVKPGTATPKASSGAFLDMKPPGSSTSPPQFTFGRSGSITLPMPAQKTPPNAMFNAFASSGAFSSGSSGVTAKPLFEIKPDQKPVQKKEEVVETVDDDDDEDGEVEE